MKIFLFLLTASSMILAQDVQKKAPQYYAALFSRGAGWDTTKGPNAQPFFKEHGLNLSRLKKEGKIAIGARYGEMGMVVFPAESEEEVRGHFFNDSLVVKDILRMEIVKFNPFYKGCIE